MCNTCEARLPAPSSQGVIFFTLKDVELTFFRDDLRHPLEGSGKNVILLYHANGMPMVVYIMNNKQI